MMKKLLSLLMIGSCAILIAQNANAQSACTPDPQFAGNPGIYPDSATGLTAAEAGNAYLQTITVVLPSDTLVTIPGVGPTTVTMDSIVVVGVRLIVAADDTTGTLEDINFAYACNPANCAFPGDASGCLVLTGAPVTADTGTYPMIVDIMVYVTHPLIGQLPGQSRMINDYSIVIDGPAGIETLNTSKFEVGQNIPNPANATTTINFTTPTQTTVDFKVYNMLGMIVQSQKVDAVSGLNKIKFNSSEVADGVYVYTLTSGNTTISKRMIVAGK